MRLTQGRGFVKRLVISRGGRVCVCVCVRVSVCVWPLWMPGADIC